MAGFSRILHCIRHAQSTFNNHPDVCGQIDGFFCNVTELDADLSIQGESQARSLHSRIHDEESHLNLLQNVEAVITSPLSRAIRTGQLALPSAMGYRYIVRPEITEQVENSTDIGNCKSILLSRFPQLREQILALDDGWWWKHPSCQEANDANPERDATVLRDHNGELPARESGENVTDRCIQFMNWLLQSQYTHVAMVSHSCTLKFLEQLLYGFYAFHENGSIPDEIPTSYYENTEVRSYYLPNPQEWAEFVQHFGTKQNHY